MSAQTIHPDDGFYVVCHWHTYPRGSVLEGQQQQVVDATFPNLEAATAAHPQAEVCEHGRCREHPSVSPQAPSGYYGSAGGFYEAGEYWGEDDY